MVYVTYTMYCFLRPNKVNVAAAAAAADGSSNDDADVNDDGESSDMTDNMDIDEYAERKEKVGNLIPALKLPQSPCNFS